MTKQERVRAVLNGQTPDYTPCGFSIHFPEEEKHGEAAVDAHLRFFRETDTDICKVMNENLVPCLGEIRRPEDWACLKNLRPDAPFLQDQIEFAAKVRDKGPKDAYWMGTLHGITASAIHPIEGACGYDGARTLLTEHLRENPEPVRDAMKRIAECMCALAQGYKEAGMDAVYYAALGGEKGRWFTGEEFEEWIAPLDKMVLSAIREAGCDVFLHICKDGLDMKRYAGYAPLCDVVNWGVYEAPFPLEEGEKLFPGKTLMGGLRNRSGVLVEGSRQEVADQSVRLSKRFGPQRFILGADCTLPTNIDPARIRWVCEALRGME